MDYEKKYKDLVEAVKELQEANPSDEGLQNWVNDNVPELKESEGERIRKAICIYLDWLDGRNKDYQPKGEYTVRDMIAWLEKQGEQKSIDDLTKQEAMDIAVAKCFEKGEKKLANNIVETWKEMRLEVYQQASGNRHEPNYSDDNTKMFSLNDIDEIIEKISEQKPVWSEEDEERLQSCLNILQAKGIMGVTDTINTNWLKSLKDRVQPQNNVTDEELAKAKKDAYNDALDKIEYHSGEPTFDDGWSAAIWYMKKKNIQPQAEQFIKDCTKTCSNEIVAKEPCFHEWVIPEQALKAIEIANEEWLSKACEWFTKHAIKYYLDGSKFLDTEKLVEDFKKAMEE